MHHNSPQTVDELKATLTEISKKKCVRVIDNLVRRVHVACKDMEPILSTLRKEHDFHAKRPS